MNRRAVLAATALLPLAMPRLARAQTVPLRLVVPAPPGGPTDILARALGDRAQATLGRPVIVDNRAGAGGIIGTEAAARAAPDGNTIVLGHNQTHASNQAMVPALPYNVIDSFVPITKLATVHHALVVPVSSPSRTLAELIARGRSGRLTYASSQAGSASHVISETLARTEKLDATHVPYRGAAPAATDTVAGIVDFYVATFPSVAPLVRDNRLRALEIGAPARLPDFPEIPTAIEAGAPYLTVDAWFGLFAPAGTPAPVVERIAEAMLGGLRDPEVAARLAGAGFTPDPLPPAAFAAFQRAEVERWREMIRLTGVTMEG
ncbi:Bug family tripartite tricarboxylate transporter substrate binding protein [Roseomonas haemaphysalidis]|uniref:Tripartite tricarboxylate transporter substrate binding protein n=1 Tax=Roseomonas haemaphysalidis TaxID=2768162 RepID=A0ABS3KU96_9PROT|nr:tripartite tricarboxylate transporter substrate binding protein [Roseomonas haemaphysalidis]MBO1081055.1 tripartite tricarboxylate transporter substrate binding protein [Roseomonas haemaphysalidis]